MPELSDAEDLKLVTLARSARARTGAPEGAAVRDLDGRTYAAAAVRLPSLDISAVGVAVAMAVSSGARGLEAVVLTGPDGVPDGELAVVRELAGPGVPVHLVAADGTLLASSST
ncbi:MAG: cytidine deaminase [Nocardioidaceae bacterium]